VRRIDIHEMSYMCKRQVGPVIIHKIGYIYPRKGLLWKNKIKYVLYLVDIHKVYVMYVREDRGVSLTYIKFRIYIEDRWVSLIYIR